MSLTTGVVGLPNVGKTTLFNALTAGNAAASNYPFCTIDPNMGVVELPDIRLETLNSLLNPTHCTRTSIQFTDIAGLVRGANEGEGRGNQFLSDVRETDALIHVVRCFEDSSVAHVEDELSPIRDVDTVESELILADLQVVAGALPHLERVVTTDPRSSRRDERDALKQIEAGLLEGVSVCQQGVLVPEKLKAVRSYHFLSAKPMLYVANIGEGDVDSEIENDERLAQLRERVGAERVLPICAQLETELVQLDEVEREEFIVELGIHSCGLDRLIKSTYQLLHLVTFYTLANEKLQAWQLTKGSSAVTAAGKIHSDMEAGFIRAEVTSVGELLAADGQIQRLRQEGRIRTEGRDYKVSDGDVVQFLFRG